MSRFSPLKAGLRKSVTYQKKRYVSDLPNSTNSPDLSVTPGSHSTGDIRESWLTPKQDNLPPILGGAFGAVPDPPPALTDGRQASRFSITNYLKAKPEDFRELAHLLNLVQEKKFLVIIDRSFPLAEARAAQRHLEGRGHFGKVVLKMS